MLSPVKATFVILAALLLPLCAHAQAIQTDHSAAALKLMHQVIEKTNIERTSRGLSPLKLQEDLTQAAVAHAQDMVKFGYFAHATPNAAAGVEDYEEYARRAHYAGRAGQNLYHGEPKASQILTCWMNSPDHRSNILETRYNEIGIGVARGRDFYDSYCVQFLGEHKNAYPVIVNNEAYSTSNPTVHLYVYGKETMKQMRFSNDGVTFTAWESFQSEHDWTLAAGEGAHTIYVQVTDGHSTYTSQDSIIVNTAQI